MPSCYMIQAEPNHLPDPFPNLSTLSWHNNPPSFSITGQWDSGLITEPPDTNHTVNLSSSWTPQTQMHSKDELQMDTL